MNANNDPLGVRSAYPFPEADAEGRPFGFRRYAKPAFAIQPHWDCRSYCSGMSRGDSGLSGKIARRDKQATGKRPAADPGALTLRLTFDEIGR